MAGKMKLKKIEHIVRMIIHEWDPYCLLEIGCPEDEFDSEISSLIGQVQRIKSAIDATHAISRVFSSAFEPELFTPKDCSEIGERLFEELKQANLIELK